MSDRSRQRRTAVVFRAHFFDREIEARLDRLIRQVGRSGYAADLHLLTDHDTVVPDRFTPILTRFCYADYSQGFANLIGDTIVPGNTHLAELFFADRFPGYDEYWVIEYDVVYTGDWGRFLAGFRDEGADLLASHVLRVVQNDPWFWADSLSKGDDGGPTGTQLSAFLPIHRVSIRGLNAVRDALHRGWSGHSETVVPTAVSAAGLVVSDIGGTGEFTPPHRRHRHYLMPDPHHIRDKLGTMRYRPPILFALVPNMLHHPCKTNERRDIARNWRAVRLAFKHAPMGAIRFTLQSARSFCRGLVARTVERAG